MNKVILFGALALTTACGPQTRMAFTVRAPAPVIVLGPNHFAEHEQRLNYCINRAIAQQEFDDLVDETIADEERFNELQQKMNAGIYRSLDGN